MSLVKDTVIPMNTWEEVNIISDNIIAGHNEVVRTQSRFQLIPLNWRSVVVQRIQMFLRNELFNFIDPVTCQSWWTDHNRRQVLQDKTVYFIRITINDDIQIQNFATAIMLSKWLYLWVIPTGHNADRLKGLSKTHVITENSMQSELIQESQPIDSSLLVWAQSSLDRYRNLELWNLCGTQKLFQKESLFQLVLEKLGREIGRIRYSAF